VGIKWAAIIASALAIAVLAMLIVGSRSVGVSDYNFHFQELDHVDSGIQAYNTLTDQLASAQRDGRSVGDDTSFAKLALQDFDQKLRVGQVSDTQEVTTLRNTLIVEIKSILQKTELIEQQQDLIGTLLSDIKSSGPQEVQRLKAANLENESQLLFQLIVQTIALSTSRTSERLDTAGTLLDRAQRSETLTQGPSVDTIRSIRQIVDTQVKLDSDWSELSRSNLVSVANDLRRNFNAAHTKRITTAENAQILLSVFSLLLIASLGYMVYRLQSSYREINQVNQELNVANDDLERRVEERTRELNDAFGDLKESQVQLVQAEKMASLGQLVAGISHEINTPLLYLQSNQTVIQEALDEFREFVQECHNKLNPKAAPTEDLTDLRKRYVRGLKELKVTLIESEIQEELDEVSALSKDNMQGLEELTHMAQGLKDFSRLDRAPIATFNVNDGIERTLLIAKNMLKGRINVIKKMQEVPLVTCAPSQINQVFLNLITNAAQSIESTGDITISTSFDNELVQVSIEDTGSGISSENLSKIRDPFFTTKEVGAGTGLGLSICEEILSAHNGRLEIKSTEGKGSTFTVLLPQNQTQAPTADIVSDGSELTSTQHDVPPQRITAAS